MKDKQKIYCQSCKLELFDLNKICDNCLSNTNEIIIELFDEFNIELRDTLSGKRINPELSSKNRLREKFFYGASRSANGDWAEKEQIVNRDDNYYYEKVTNSAGEVIRECEEKLTEHRGRGSAKFNRNHE